MKFGKAKAKAKVQKARAKTRLIIQQQRGARVLEGACWNAVPYTLRFLCDDMFVGDKRRVEIVTQQPGTLTRVRKLVRAAKAVRDEDCCDPIGDDKRLLEALDALEGRL